MKDFVFSALLRLPRFRGRDRLTLRVRDALYRPKAVRGLFGMRLFLDPMEWTQLELMQDPHGQEPLTLALFGQLLRSGDTYVDVGTHIGLHTLVARHYIGPTGFVLAVEPQPYHGDKILANWQLNGFENIAVQLAAAGAKRDFISLPHQPSSDRARLSLLNEEGRMATQKLVCRVPVLPLADVFEQNGVPGTIRLLKIDVEGFEVAVLSGLGTRVSQVENIVLELLATPELRETESLPVLDKLSELGFRCWRTAGGDRWKPGTPLPENNLWASREMPPG